jgi:hypothetical protein
LTVNFEGQRGEYLRPCIQTHKVGFPVIGKLVEVAFFCYAARETFYVGFFQRNPPSRL